MERNKIISSLAAVMLIMASSSAAFATIVGSQKPHIVTPDTAIKRLVGIDSLIVVEVKPKVPIPNYKMDIVFYDENTWIIPKSVVSVDSGKTFDIHEVTGDPADTAVPWKVTASGGTYIYHWEYKVSKGLGTYQKIIVFVGMATTSADFTGTLALYEKTGEWIQIDGDRPDAKPLTLKITTAATQPYKVGDSMGIEVVAYTDPVTDAQGDDAISTPGVAFSTQDPSVVGDAAFEGDNVIGVIPPSAFTPGFRTSEDTAYVYWTTSYQVGDYLSLNEGLNTLYPAAFLTDDAGNFGSVTGPDGVPSGVTSSSFQIMPQSKQIALFLVNVSQNSVLVGKEIPLEIVAYNADTTRVDVDFAQTGAVLEAVGATDIAWGGNGVTDNGNGTATLDDAGWIAGRRFVTISSIKPQSGIMVEVSDATGLFTGGSTELSWVPPVDPPDILIVRDYMGADGMGDQGGFVLMTFDLSQDHQMLTDYRIYREITLSFGREEFIPWAKVDPVPGVDSIHVVVPALDNVPTRWAVAAEMGAATSGRMPSPKRIGKGELLLATLDPAAMEQIFGTRPDPGIRAKVLSSGTRTSPMTITSDKVRAVDNIPPAPVGSIHASDTPFDDGGSITVSWEKSPDDRILSAYEVNGQTVPLLGVQRYVVYRQKEGGEWEPIGAPGSGGTTFIDKTVEDVVSYTYTVRAADLDNETEGPVASGWAQALGDVSWDGSVHAYDATLILRNVVGSIVLPDPTWPGFVMDIADVSGNRSVTAFDASLILRRVVGLIDRYPVQVGAPAILAGTFPETRTVRLSDVPKSGEETFVVPVSLDERNRVFSGYLEIAFDPALFEADEVVTPESSGYAMVGAIEEGRVRIAFATSEPSSGPGGVAEVRFRVLEPEEDVVGTLTLEKVQLNEGMTAVRPISGTYGAPTAYALSQNYPNPFNPETTIRYAIPSEAWVTLMVYNAAGQRIRTLVEREQAAGYHRAVWDGRDDGGQEVASGVYLYTLRSDRFAEVKRMILLK